ncbi:hypothetical protein CLOSTMETH_03344 [[Clostridium] methylpentosum DSM 5476]|uniref:Uncharacterized protein n=1 Tax=[Clostridium] methylpentosum DSM 5476 TaxID=537013 RepID=C0EHJ9_9FIRM|nr:hypothetical protein CLOSTMETH_03344 [[Clostridium] methylpentosum DSM 5476]
MYMIRAHFCFYVFYLLSLTKRSHYFSYFCPLLFIEHFPSIF